MAQQLPFLRIFMLHNRYQINPIWIINSRKIFVIDGLIFLAYAAPIDIE